MELSLVQSFFSLIQSDPQYNREPLPHCNNSVRLAQRVMSYILHHHHEPLKLPKVCSDCGASATAINVAFRSVWGLSPMQFLMALRMSGAKHDLLTAEKNQSVSDVAMGRGFLHLGRFSQYYKRQFGEHPSQTLRRSKTRRVKRPSLAAFPC